jgi:uncharacterized protein YndB with AHSA1/START domain
MWNAHMADPIVHASQLIRRPPGEVFAAFTNPLTLTRFWLRHATGPLAPGARVEWEFMVPGAKDTVRVVAFESPRHLALRFSDGTLVDMMFQPRDGDTRVAVAISGFDPADLLAQATNSVEGFAIVLCDLKTLLETGESAGLVRDKAALIEAEMRKTS